MKNKLKTTADRNVHIIVFLFAAAASHFGTIDHGSQESACSPENKYNKKGKGGGEGSSSLELNLTDPCRS